MPLSRLSRETNGGTEASDAAESRDAAAAAVVGGEVVAALFIELSAPVIAPVEGAAAALSVCEIAATAELTLPFRRTPPGA